MKCNKLFHFAIWPWITNANSIFQQNTYIYIQFITDSCGSVSMRSELNKTHNLSSVTQKQGGKKSSNMHFFSVEHNEKSYTNQSESVTRVFWVRNAWTVQDLCMRSCPTTPHTQKALCHTTKCLATGFNSFTDFACGANTEAVAEKILVWTSAACQMAHFCTYSQ